jgi:hypothetical protein
MPDTVTYTPIATNTLSSSAASVTFSSIAGTFKDLVLVCWVKTSSNDIGLRMQFNTDTGSNYSVTQLYGNGSTAASNRQSSQTSIRWANNLATAGGIGIANIQNYSNATTYKTMISRGGYASYGVNSTVGLWRSTSAITSIVVFDEDSGSMASGSTFTLYGIGA